MHGPEPSPSVTLFDYLTAQVTARLASHTIVVGLKRVAVVSNSSVSIAC